MAAIMSGVSFWERACKAGPLRLSRVPPTGSSLLNAAASPSTHAFHSAWEGMLGMIIDLDRGAGRSASAGSATGVR